MRIINSKASILGAALVILGIMLTIAIGVSTVSVLERKASIGSNQSITAYQSADTGVERVLKEINKVLAPTDSVGMIAPNIGASCNSDGLIEEVGKFKVELKDSGEQKVRCDSGLPISSISSIKSTGSSPQESRAIEVALAATSEACALCLSCGGNWPYKTGGFAVDDDSAANIKVMRGAACVDPMQNRPTATWGEISLCCK